MERTNIYRLAALLYTNQNGSLNRDVALRKVIENAMVDLDNKPTSAHQLVILIKEKYDLIVTIEEVLEIVTNSKNRGFQVDYSHDHLLSLTKERYELLVKQQEQNLEYFVDLYLKENGFGENEKELINHYIYRVFDNNLSDFSSILCNSNVTREKLFDDFTDEQNQIIKGFLEWDNPEKNKMLLTISNYALEYTFLTGNSSNINNSNFRNVFNSKKIYIDTNIIFYCLGINGEEYSKTNRIFLKKCLDSKSIIAISYFANEEFKSTIYHVIEELERFVSPSIYKASIQRNISDQDIYKLYLQWASGKKQLRAPKYFKEYLINKYQEFIDEFKISVDRAKPFSDKEISESDKIQEYITDIPYSTHINYDALNIFYIESLRGKSKQDIISTQYIFVTADMSLQRWDNQREGTSVVVGPSAWLTLMARLLGRNEDDYKCFVSFINLKSPRSEINNKEYFQIVQILSEMIEDIEAQESILNVMVEESFKFLESSEKRTSEFIVEKTQNEVQVLDRKMYRDLQEKREKDREEITKLKSEVETTKREKYLAQEELHKKQVDFQEHQELQKENSELKDSEKRLKKYIKKCFRRSGIILIITIPIILELFSIFVYKVSNPISYRIYTKAIKNTVFESAGMEGYYHVTQWVIYAVIVLLDVWLSKIMWNKKARNEFLKNCLEE